MTLEECQKTLRRYEKIVKHSDKMEKKVLELYHKLEEKEKTLRERYEYEKSQLQIAKAKVEENLVVEIPPILNSKILFQSLDILSGDIYSIYKIDENKVLYFIADGQGHGVSPAITVFNLANIFKSTIKFFKKNLYFENYLNSYVLEPIKYSLIDYEQLSYTIIFLDLQKEKLFYSIGGMYPTLIKTDETLKIKANNLPLTKSTKKIEVDSVEIKNFKKIISYSDGIIEIFINEIRPKNLIEDPNLIDTISNYKAEDDVTIIYLEKRKTDG